MFAQGALPGVRSQRSALVIFPCLPPGLCRRRGDAGRHNRQNQYLHVWRAFGINAVLISFTYVPCLCFEKAFGFTSTVTLVELSDVNNPSCANPLLRKCPGIPAFQVSNLGIGSSTVSGAPTCSLCAPSERYIMISERLIIPHSYREPAWRQ